MLNGKFYTGLTANQINRTRSGGAPDRQKSSFYWPDESDTQPAVPNRSAAAVRQKQFAKGPAIDRSSADDDRNPKDRFHTQLTSKIEFYDEHKATPKPRRRIGASQSSTKLAPKLTDIASAQDISDITASLTKASSNGARNEKSAAKPPPVNGRRQPVPVASRTNRKITFDEDSTASKPRSILKKNNELRGNAAKRNAYDVDPIPAYKQNLMVRGNRIQLSKSMDNFSKLHIATDDEDEPDVADAKIIGTTKRNNVEREREVNERRKREANDIEDGLLPAELEYFDKWNTGDDFADERGQGSWRERGEIVKMHSSNRSATGERIERHEQRASNTINSYRYESADDNDEYDKPYQPVKSAGQTGKPDTRTDEDNDEIGYARHFADVNQAPVRRPNVVQQPAAANERRFANEAAKRAQTHLRSNIFFNDGVVGGSYADDRPRSVRESAVARVGVGLPNI